MLADATIDIVDVCSPPWLHAAASALAALLPHAEHVTLDGLDHSAAVMAPQALVPVLVDFLGE